MLSICLTQPPFTSCTLHAITIGLLHLLRCVMAMKNFLIGLSKFVLGLILAMLIMSLAGLSMARYFMTRMVEKPERPTYENDLPEDQRPRASTPPSGAGSTSEAEPARAAAPKPASSNEYAAFATTNVNLRSGPGTSYDTIGSLGTDENVTVIGEDGGWLNVIISNGSEGWVSGNYVEAN